MRFISERPSLNLGNFSPSLLPAAPVSAPPQQSGFNISDLFSLGAEARQTVSGLGEFATNTLGDFFGNLQDVAEARLNGANDAVFAQQAVADAETLARRDGANDAVYTQEIIAEREREASLNGANDAVHAQEIIAERNRLAEATDAETTAPPAEIAPEDYPDSVKALGENLLARGHASPEVEKLQELLNAQGHELEVDGIFGPKTEDALKAYQQEQLDAQTEADKMDPEKAFKVDGIVGPQTRGALAKDEIDAAATAAEDAKLNGAADHALAENTVAERRAEELSGAGDHAKAENIAAERRAGELSGAGDHAKAENLAAEKTAERNAERAPSGDDKDSEGKGPR